MGQEVALNLTSSGHYCIPIDRMEEIPVRDVFAVELGDMDRKSRSMGSGVHRCLLS